jgi:hypothetical protein
MKNINEKFIKLELIAEKICAEISISFFYRYITEDILLRDGSRSAM